MSWESKHGARNMAAVLLERNTSCRIEIDLYVISLIQQYWIGLMFFSHATGEL
jgi:hypothetical protein